MKEQHEVCPHCGAVDYTIEAYKGTHVFKCHTCNHEWQGDFDVVEEITSFDPSMTDDKQCEEFIPPNYTHDIGGEA